MGTGTGYTEKPQGCLSHSLCIVECLIGQQTSIDIAIHHTSYCHMSDVQILKRLSALLCSLLIQPSQPAIGIFFACFFVYFTHFCSLFFSLLCSLLSQPSQIQPTPFSTQLHLPILIPHSPFSLYRFITSACYFFLTLELHVCKYVDSKCIIFLN